MLEKFYELRSPTITIKSRLRILTLVPVSSDEAVSEFDDAAYFSDEIATFGDRVAGAREVMGLSRQQLAERLGIKEETLSKWEEDRSEPRANKLQMLAGVLNVSMIWLMTGEGGGAPDVEDPGSGAVSLQDVLSELREIRTEQVRLVERSKVLEKRLRGLIAGG